VLHLKLLFPPVFLLLFAFHGILIGHVHPFPHKLIICLVFMLLGLLLLLHLQVQLFLDVSESFLSLVFLALLIECIFLFFLYLVLDYTPLKFLFRLVTLLYH